MSGTQITQSRQPVLIDEGTKYQVSATCTFAGTLPSVYIFTRQVVQEADPKNDVFLRVASVTDFTDFGTDRQAAITNGTFTYRAVSFVQNYDNVTTATDAWAELSARIGTLVADYDVYITDFLTPVDGAITIYPTVDESTKTALIETYVESVSAVSAAEQARDTENISCQALLLELQTKQQQLLEATADINTISPIVAATNVLSPSYVNYQASINANNASAIIATAVSSATAPEKAAITAPLNVITTQLAAMFGSNTSLEDDVRIPLLGFLGTLQSRAAGYQADVTALQVEYNECMVEMASLQAAVDQARAQRDANLAAVRAVCPDYVP
jgi:hypothetical protein